MIAGIVGQGETEVITMNLKDFRDSMGAQNVENETTSEDIIEHIKGELNSP